MRTESYPSHPSGLSMKIDSVQSQLQSLDSKIHRTQDGLRDLQKCTSASLGKSHDIQLHEHSELIKQLHSRVDSNEGAVYEFRKESFTNMNEVEKIFLQKNDVMRRAFAEVCKHIGVSNPLPMH